MCFVQWHKNKRFHFGIGRTIFKAMFDEKSHLVLMQLILLRKLRKV